MATLRDVLAEIAGKSDDLSGRAAQLIIEFDKMCWTKFHTRCDLVDRLLQQVLPIAAVFAL